MLYNFLWTFNKEKTMCMHSHTTALFITVFLCMTMKPLNSTFPLSPIRQKCESAKLQREKFDGVRTKLLRSWGAKIRRQRVKKRRCAVAKAKKRYYHIAHLLRNCALSSSHPHTFAFTFFSLHNLMQVPYLSEVCRRRYGVIALNAVWRPSCFL